ncbi:MAG: transposase [Beijerinckiaceae bacterium]|nr:transposase [Beijerinckiaceae bacterium]
MAYLAEVEAGKAITDVCRLANVSLRTFYRWKERYGCLTPQSVSRMRMLEDENRKLRRMLVLSNQISLAAAAMDGAKKQRDVSPRPRSVMVGSRDMTARSDSYYTNCRHR